MERLSIQRWHLEFRTTRRTRLPFYSGSMWRGAFGHALKRNHCRTGLPDCNRCPENAHCEYAQLFAPQTAHPTRFRDQPRHYIFHTPWAAQRDYPTNTPLNLEFSLISGDPQHAKAALKAITDAAANGLGREQAPLTLISAARHSTPPTPAPPEQPLKITLTTPLRLRRQGKNLSPEQFRPLDLFKACQQRASLLEPTNQPKRINQLHEIEQASRWQLNWADWQRHSSRQQRHIPLGGLLGEIELPSPAEHFPEHWPALWQGQFTHIGKATVMGLGGYRIETKNFSETHRRPTPGQAQQLLMPTTDD